MFLFILCPLVHPYMVFYKFGTWTVKFTIRLRMNEMNKIFNCRISTTLWPLKQLGITQNSLGWNFINNKTWCKKPNYMLMFQNFLNDFSKLRIVEIKDNQHNPWYIILWMYLSVTKLKIQFNIITWTLCGLFFFV